jgi:hypothetical protein
LAQPPAILAAECESASIPPDPLIDPERARWEADTVMRLETCKGKHKAAINGWIGAVTPEIR